LTGIDRPTNGEVIFDGKSIVAQNENSLARWRGARWDRVPVFHLLPTLTALENVLLALELGRGGGLAPRQYRSNGL
jgi:predicted ABC-type transport system involved in lysophospholipase L1 biosynthesis ATPase subunit